MAIHFASYYGYVNIAKLLIEKCGVDINVRGQVSLLGLCTAMCCVHIRLFILSPYSTNGHL